MAVYFRKMICFVGEVKAQLALSPSIP